MNFTNNTVIFYYEQQVKKGEFMHFFACLATPLLLLGSSLTQIFFENGKKITLFLLAVSSLLFLFTTIVLPAQFIPLHGYGFVFSRFTCLCSCFILFISTVVFAYSIKYLDGDCNKNKFICRLSFLIVSLLLFITANHLFLIALFWMSSNALLSLIMIHKRQFDPALASGKLFLKNACLSFSCLALGFFLLGNSLKTYSLYDITHHTTSLSPLTYLGLLFTLIAACIQSGIWPFHKWLVSSLNSPTPVSAFMHAGLINGGGLLIIRLSPFLAENQSLLHILFFVGCISAFIGSISKLVQPAVKNMLACSTLAQMGFMLLQCGLGLFSCAFVHVICHGFFKAYLFLNSGNALEQSTPKLSMARPRTSSLLLASLATTLGTLLFYALACIGHKSDNSVIFISVITAISIWQMSYYLTEQRSGVLGSAIAVFCGLIFGCIYGLFIYVTEKFLFAEVVIAPVNITIIHWVALSVFIIAAIALLLREKLSHFNRSIYVNVLNIGQSCNYTNSSQRIDYNRSGV